MQHMPYRPHRSALYVPASNARALGKVASLDCDCVIVDLEDAVAPQAKRSARESLIEFFASREPTRHEMVIRVNAASSEWGADDLMAARRCRPQAILLPKVSTPRDVLEANDRLDDDDANPKMALWAMIETPAALLNIGAIAELGRDASARLSCLVAGTNDLVKETGIDATQDRQWLVPWLMQIVLAARAGGIDALDGVFNDFADTDGFERECAQGRSMGFDGKTLIHPAQVPAANAAYSPSTSRIAEAKAIVAAFARPENTGRGVISVDGRMVERLHLTQAERLLAKAERLA